jgi:hypothetical protein
VAFDPDAWLRENAPPAKGKAKAAAFDPDAYLAREAARATVKIEPDRGEFHTYLGDGSPGRVDVRGGQGEWVPEKRARAVFTDLPNEPPMTGQRLGAIKEDTLAKGRAALAGGAVQGATLGFGDEIAAVAGSIVGDGTYRELRDEARKADKDAQAGDPKAYGAGRMIGGVATMALPGGAVNAAKPLLSLANTGRAAAMGGAVALGESEADLTKGEIGKAAWDVTKGATVGAGVNTGLGLVGKGVRAGRQFIASAPERVAARADAELTDALTLGAPASKRDALMGPLGLEKPEVLALVRSDPRLPAALKAGDRATAAEIVQDAQAAVVTERSAALAAMEQAKGGQRVKPFLDKLTARRDSLLANPTPEAQATAAKIQKQIDLVTERWVPAPKAPPLKGNELVGKLVESADPGDKQRAGLQAVEWARVAEKHKLAKVAEDPEARSVAIAGSLEKLGKKRDAIYDSAKKPIYVANVTGKLREWADELRKDGMRLADAANVDAMAANIMAANGRDGRRLSMPAAELRSLVSSAQENAFAGKYIDPTTSKAMQRKAANILKDLLDEHIEKTAGAAAANRLREINKEFSALITFKNAAEKDLAKSRLVAPVVVPPETRTGKAPIGELHALSRSVDDDDIARDVTGALYDQIGKNRSRKLSALDRREDLLKRLEDPLAHKAAREASPPTTLRHHAGTIKQFVQNSGVTGGMVLLGLGRFKEGAAVIGASMAAKYGAKVAQASERGIAAMVQAHRMGAGPLQLRTLAKYGKVPTEIAEDVIATLAPREAASATVRKKGK